MTIYLSHFDTRVKQDLDVREPIQNSLAEYLFPDVTFAIGEINTETVKAEDLQNYKGMSLQLSSGKRMYFADKPIREAIYPRASDGAAYGSLLFTPCKEFFDLRELRVLVVDDLSGENDGILPQEQAKALVGDCYGKMSLYLAQKLTGKENSPFQFRLGIKPQKNNSLYRVAKGTLAPDKRLETLTSRVLKIDGKYKMGYDLVLPTSSFKGRKGLDAIAPGEHILDIGIGVKSIAQYGKQSLGPQVLLNYPRAVKEDLLPILKKDISELADKQSNIYSLAQYFLKTYQERSKLQNEYLAGGDDLPFLSNLDLPIEESRENNLYELIKQDLEHHAQLLEHPYIVEELEKFLQRQWSDLALGRTIKFQSALAQPSYSLNLDQVCIPRMPDGALLIVTRSPLVNSNGVILLKNRHLPQLMNIDGCIHIHPATAAQHLQADFDGDRLAFERAERYPTLTAEIRESLSSTKRYLDVLKRDKVAYQGSFAEIAISAMQNDIGKIANQIMAAVALRWEATLLPDELKKSYVLKAANFYSSMLARQSDSKAFEIPSDYLEDIQSIVQSSKALSRAKVESALESLRNIQYKIISALSNELQVAVDGPKSALRPDLALLSACKELSAYQSVSWLASKKDKSVYRSTPMNSSNYSPVDLMIQQANEKWQETRLIARPIEQFRSLFLENRDPRLMAKVGEIKEKYNSYLKLAFSMETLKMQFPELIEPYLELEVPNGNKLYITRLERFATLSSKPYSLERPLEFKFVENTIAPDIPNSHLALISQEDNDGQILSQPIGAVAYSTVLDGLNSLKAQGVIRPGLTQERIQTIYKELENYVDSLREQYPDDVQKTLAGALWNVAHTKDLYNTKKALLAFKIFPKQVIGQLEQLNFDHIKIVGLQFPTNEYGQKQWQGEVVDCQLVLHPIPDRNGQLENKTVLKIQDKILAPLSNESASLPVGTTFKAQLTSDPYSTLLATSPKGNSLTIKQVKNFAFAQSVWQGQVSNITVALVKQKGKEVPLASLDGIGLGILDNDSERKLRELNLLSNKGFTFSATLQSLPSTSANIQIKPETVIYPWQQKAREELLEQRRASYRAQYDGYIKEIANSPNLVSNKDRDVEVAMRAFADNPSKTEVMAIISQSDLVRQWRDTVPSARSWEDYLKLAKEYVEIIHQEANSRLHTKEPTY